MAIKEQKNKISRLTINDLAIMMKDGFKTQEKQLAVKSMILRL